MAGVRRSEGPLKGGTAVSGKYICTDRYLVYFLPLKELKFSIYITNFAHILSLQHQVWGAEG